MTDILNIASTGLQAFQRALATTGDNIANASTDGYSRQTVEFESRPTTRQGTMFVGNGVDIAAIRRNTDVFAVRQIREAKSVFESVNQFYNCAIELDGLLSGDDSSLSGSIQQFFSAVNAVNANPTDTASRQVLLSQSAALTNRFKQLDTSCKQQISVLNDQLSAMVATINSLSSSLAAVNSHIVGGITPAPELLDQRDSIIKELASYVAIQTIDEPDGTISVGIGNGISLVTSGVATPLGAVRSNENPELMSVSVLFNNSSYEISNRIQGGQLGGLLSYRDDMLNQASNELDRICLALTDSLNSQNELGMDLNGNLGISFFNSINTPSLQQGRAITNLSNIGTMQLSIAIDNISQLTTSDYQLIVTKGPAYQLIRASDNTSTNIAGFPVTIDGFTINLTNGTASAGDTFLISPNKGASAAMTLNLNSTSDFAIASPIRTIVNTANHGTGIISMGDATDTTNASFTTTPHALTPPIQVKFLSATSYQLVNANTSAVIAGPLTYDPTSINDLFPTSGAYDPGYRVSISGAVQTGDQFAIVYNTGGVSDNRNGNSIAKIQTENLLDGGSVTLQSAYSSLISSVGTQTSQAEINLDASQILLAQAEERLDTTSGVNLDEEAANLIKYQQAYEAAAQVIAIASRLFDTLLGVFH